LFFCEVNEIINTNAFYELTFALSFPLSSYGGEGVVRGEIREKELLRLY
jgi:hypothetical protein